MNIHRFARRFCLSALLCSAVSMPASATCPVGLGWSEGLKAYLPADAPFPTSDTKAPPPADPATLDCVFQQWSAEAFVWAVAPGPNGVPRFLQFQTTSQLLSTNLSATRPLTLQLAARSAGHVGEAGFSEGAGAIVQADGNMLVAPNGYPVYASVHMDPSYFATARANMIANGGYNTQPPDSYFNVELLDTRKIIRSSFGRHLNITPIRRGRPTISSRPRATIQAATRSIRRPLRIPW